MSIFQTELSILEQRKGFPLMETGFCSGKKNFPISAIFATGEGFLLMKVAEWPVKTNLPTVSQRCASWEGFPLKEVGECSL